MKQLTPEQLQHAANILWALDHAEPLEILQYVGSQEDPPTYSQIAEAIGISDSLVKYNVSRLEQEGILTVSPVPTFEDPEAGLVQMKELSEMPTLAQAIILELWPDWSGLPEVKPEYGIAPGSYNVTATRVEGSEQIEVGLTSPAPPYGLHVKIIPTSNHIRPQVLVTVMDMLADTEKGRQFAEEWNTRSAHYGFKIDLEDPSQPWNRTSQLV